MNSDSPTTERFEDRLLAVILDDFDNLTADRTSAGSRLARRPANVRLSARTTAPLALAATAAAAVVAVAGVALVGSNTGAHTTPAPAVSGPGTAVGPGASQAQLVAYQLASASATAPANTGRYVVLPETDTETGQGQIQRTTVIDTQTGASTTYQQLPAGSNAPAVGSAGPNPTWTEAWFAALPTDPIALRTQLLAIAKQQASQEQGALQQLSAPTGQAIPTPKVRQTMSDDDYVYQEADALLWNPLVEPELRAALYNVLAATGGYSVNLHAIDPSGRPAIAMTRTYTGIAETDITYEDPATGAVLAQVWNGADNITAIYQPVTSSNTLPPDPYTH